MKLIIICALVAVAFAYESDGIHEKSDHAAGLHLSNPYKHLFRSRQSIQICTPGSTKTIDSYDCQCSENSFGWSCTLREYPQPPAPPVHEVADGLITHPDQAKRLARSKRGTIPKECDKEGDVKHAGCFTCYCDSEGFYSTCLTGVGCDLDNINSQISGDPNVGQDFNLENYTVQL